MKNYCIVINNPTKEDFNNLSDVMNVLQEETNKHTTEESIKLGVSFGCATDIIYLRTRSRWTQEKEDYLIFCDKNNTPSPSIMEDFEVPKH